MWEYQLQEAVFPMSQCIVRFLLKLVVLTCPRPFMDMRKEALKGIMEKEYSFSNLENLFLCARTRAQKPASFILLQVYPIMELSSYQAQRGTRPLLLFADDGVLVLRHGTRVLPPCPL